MGGLREALAERYFWRIRRRMLIQNKNWLAVVCGETGSGKSYSALTIADRICPRGVSIKRNLVFNPVQLLERINNKDSLRKGDILIFDEAGVGMSARDWYSVQNKLLGAILQTFRHLNVGVIFTVPNFSFVDVQARKLYHAYLETSHIDYDAEMAYLKVYDIQHNSRLDKTYFKHPKFVDEHGRLMKVGMLGVPKISDELSEEYEAAKTAYTEDLNQRALDELTGKKKPDRKGRNVAAEQEIKEDIVKHADRYKRYKGEQMFLDHGAIMQDYDLAHHKALRIKKAAEQEIREKQPETR